MKGNSNDKRHSNSNPVKSTLDWMGTMKSTRDIIGHGSMGDGIEFSVRSLDPIKDLPVIHRWVNLDYAKTFWQMEGSLSLLMGAYQQMLGLQHVHSLVGLIDGKVVCQMDVYLPEFDTIGEFYKVQEGDIGVHLLLCPERTKVVNFSAKLVSFFCGLFFLCAAVKRIVAEPDHRNRAANWLLRRLDFECHGLLNLPEKTACFYSLTKEQYSMIPAALLPGSINNTC